MDTRPTTCSTSFRHHGYQMVTKVTTCPTFMPHHGYQTVTKLTMCPAFTPRHGYQTVTKVTMCPTSTFTFAPWLPNGYQGDHVPHLHSPPWLPNGYQSNHVPHLHTSPWLPKGYQSNHVPHLRAPIMVTTSQLVYTDQSLSPGHDNLWLPSNLQATSHLFSIVTLVGREHLYRP